MNLNSIGGRKFIITLTGMLMTGFLVYTGHIADTIFSAVMMALIAAYIAGNVIQKKNEAA